MEGESMDGGIVQKVSKTIRLEFIVYGTEKESRAILTKDVDLLWSALRAQGITDLIRSRTTCEETGITKETIEFPEQGQWTEARIRMLIEEGF